MSESLSSATIRNVMADLEEQAVFVSATYLGGTGSDGDGLPVFRANGGNARAAECGRRGRIRGEFSAAHTRGGIGGARRACAGEVSKGWELSFRLRSPRPCWSMSVRSAAGWARGGVLVSTGGNTRDKMIQPGAAIHPAGPRPYRGIFESPLRGMSAGGDSRGPCSASLPESASNTIALSRGA